MDTVLRTPLFDGTVGMFWHQLNLSGGGKETPLIAAKS
jgi:hypothetical protein